MPRLRRHLTPKRTFANSAHTSIDLTTVTGSRYLGAARAHQIDPRVMIATDVSDAKEGVSSFLEKRKPNFTGPRSTDMPAFFPWWQEQEFR